MDEYRPTLLGRALADVLQELERNSAIAEADSDALFAIFDDVMRSEFAAAEPKRKSKASEEASDAVVFTHRSMDLKGSAQSFNRFMEKWTVHTTLDTQRSDSLRLDGVPVDLHMGHLPSIDMVLKVHDLPKETKSKRRK